MARAALESKPQPVAVTTALSEVRQLSDRLIDLPNYHFKYRWNTVVLPVTLAAFFACGLVTFLVFIATGRFTWQATLVPTAFVFSGVMLVTTLTAPSFGVDLSILQNELLPKLDACIKKEDWSSFWQEMSYYERHLRTYNTYESSEYTKIQNELEITAFLVTALAAVFAVFSSANCPNIKPTYLRDCAIPDAKTAISKRSHQEFALVLKTAMFYINDRDHFVCRELVCVHRMLTDIKWLDTKHGNAWHV